MQIIKGFGGLIRLYAGLAALGGVALMLSLFLPSACIVWLLIGLPCPACGLTRAFFALLRLDITAALAMHPLFWAVPFVPLMAHSRLSDKMRNVLAFSFLGVFLAVYALRMLLLFPHTEPMVINTEAWLIPWGD